jgi:hypothetical protein
MPNPNSNTLDIYCSNHVIQVNKFNVLELTWTWCPDNALRVPVVRIIFLDGRQECVFFRKIAKKYRINILVWLRQCVSDTKQKNWNPFWARFAWYFDPDDISFQRYANKIHQYYILTLFVFCLVFYRFIIVYGITILFGNSDEIEYFNKLASLSSKSHTTAFMYYVTTIIAFFYIQISCNGKFVANRFYEKYYSFPLKKSLKTSAFTLLLTFFIISMFSLIFAIILFELFLMFYLMMKLLLIFFLYVVSLLKFLYLLYISYGNLTVARRSNLGTNKDKLSYPDFLECFLIRSSVCPEHVPSSENADLNAQTDEKRP